MYIIIAGCGRLGKELAVNMCNEGHDIVVIDENQSHLETLPEGFNGITVNGMPFDEDTLMEAGIQNADAVAAVTDDDNINLMTSEIARSLYHVKVVLTRISDSEKVSTFESLGFHVICPTRAAALQAESFLAGKEQL